MKLTNKVAIVTAAGRGIGRSIALCLAEEGADVVVNSYSEDTTTRTAGDVQALGRRGLAMPCDITKPDAITQVLEESLNTFGKIDILGEQRRGRPQDVEHLRCRTTFAMDRPVGQYV